MHAVKLRPDELLLGALRSDWLLLCRLLPRGLPSADDPARQEARALTRPGRKGAGRGSPENHARLESRTEILSGSSSTDLTPESRRRTQTCFPVNSLRRPGRTPAPPSNRCSHTSASSSASRFLPPLRQRRQQGKRHGTAGAEPRVGRTNL